MARNEGNINTGWALRACFCLAGEALEIHQCIDGIIHKFCIKHDVTSWCLKTTLWYLEDSKNSD